MFKKEGYYIKLLSINQCVFAIIFLLLNACATTPAYHFTRWPTRQKQLTALNGWKIRGNLTLKAPRVAESASLYFKQDNKNYTIRLFGPLGLGSIVIDGRPHRVTLHTAQKPPLTTQNPEELLQKEFGWHLPVSNLYYWIKGLPVPQKKTTLSFDRYHHLIHLEQEGWTIDYAHYKTYGPYDLPHDVFLTNARLKIQIHIAIHSWA